MPVRRISWWIFIKAGLRTSVDSIGQPKPWHFSKRNSNFEKSTRSRISGLLSYFSVRLRSGLPAWDGIKWKGTRAVCVWPKSDLAFVISQEPLPPQDKDSIRMKRAGAMSIVLCLTAMHKDRSRGYYSVEVLIQDIDLTVKANRLKRATIRSGTERESSSGATGARCSAGSKPEPGSTVGWGFTIESPTDFLLIESFDFVSVRTCRTETLSITPSLKAYRSIGTSPESDIFAQRRRPARPQFRP